MLQSRWRANRLLGERGDAGVRPGGQDGGGDLLAEAVGALAVDHTQRPPLAGAQMCDAFGAAQRPPPKAAAAC